ncbi:hypothetical protein EYF80_047150 [Liparis tanakae]|uniref:Uncharacterized protein n=1 Tax=Liparis tanakae TaxID=230148 RepID=A0A4Z2FPE4_9TELE|nr:hypothetical protein EYF80_047150 [Liparis tanakae]
MSATDSGTKGAGQREQGRNSERKAKFRRPKQSDDTVDDRSPSRRHIFLHASTASIQLLFGEGERPFAGKLREVEVGILPLQVLVQDGKLPVPPREALTERKNGFVSGTHHKPLGVLLDVFVRGNGNGHRLLVAVVVVGLDIVSDFQSVRLLSWNRQHGQRQLLLPRTDEVHHLLMGGTFHAHPVPGGGERAGGRRNSRAAAGEDGARQSPTSGRPPYAACLDVYLYRSVDRMKPVAQPQS